MSWEEKKFVLARCFFPHLTARFGVMAVEAIMAAHLRQTDCGATVNA